MEATVEHAGTEQRRRAEKRLDGSGRMAARLARRNRIGRTNLLRGYVVRARDSISPGASPRDARRIGLLRSPPFLCCSVCKTVPSVPSVDRTMMTTRTALITGGTRGIGLGIAR